MHSVTVQMAEENSNSKPCPKWNEPACIGMNKWHNLPANNSIKDVIGYHVTLNESDALSDHVTLVCITQLLHTSK